MDNIKIVDQRGKWYVYSGQYVLVDPNGTRFEPGVNTKATASAWAEEQVTAGGMAYGVDPFAEPEKAEAPAPAPAPAPAETPAPAPAPAATLGTPVVAK